MQAKLLGSSLWLRQKPVNFFDIIYYLMKVAIRRCRTFFKTHWQLV